MRLLITGASGLIGNAIVQVAIERGYDIHYLTTQKSHLNFYKKARGFLWNPSKEEIDTDCFNGVDAIINLAGASISSRWTRSYKQVILESRVNSLQTLYKGIEQVGVQQIKSFVSASAIGIYPHCFDTFYKETHLEKSNDFLGKVVQKWEQEAARFNDFNLEITQIRIGLVLSNQGGALPQISKSVKMGFGAIIGSGDQWQSWIHIQDLARFFIYSIEHRLQGIYNAVSPNPIRQREMIKTLGKKYHRKILLPKIPGFVFKWILGEMAYLLLSSQCVSAVKAKKSQFQYQFETFDSALEDLITHK